MTQLRHAQRGIAAAQTAHRSPFRGSQIAGLMPRGEGRLWRMSYSRGVKWATQSRRLSISMIDIQFRVTSSLQSRGHLEGLRPDELFAHDQDHYGGLAATDELARGAQNGNRSGVTTQKRRSTNRYVITLSARATSSVGT